MMKKGKTCRHYNSPHDNTHCEAGVCYKDVTPDPDVPGSAWRLPCKEVTSEHGLRVLAELGPQGECEKRDWLTPEEEEERRKKFEKLINESIARMQKCTPLITKIKREHAGEDWQGVEECPICGGRLHMRISSYNGHVHGRCETEGCMAWME